MESLIKDCLAIGLKSKGFNLDFEAKADIDGGFECYMFSNETHVSIITGECLYAKKGGGKAKMVYKHYCCRLGDDEYLKRFLELENIMHNPSLLTGVYGGLFARLINKITSYGTKNAGRLIRFAKNDDSICDVGVVNQCPRGEAVHALCI